MQAFETSGNILVAAAPGDILSVPCHSEAEIRKIVITASVASATVGVFNRAFTTPTVDVLTIDDDGNGKCRLTLATPLAVNVGDLLTVAGNTVAGYNVATHRVTWYSADDKTLITDKAYSALGTGGTVKLDIPATEQELYRVMPDMPVDSNVLVYVPTQGVVFFNQDPMEFHRSSPRQLLYFRFSAAGTYRVTVAGIVQD